jgi:protein TonB
MDSMKAPEPSPDSVASGGITPDSTAEGGNFAVPTGNTLYAPPPQGAPVPEEVRPYAAEKYALAATLTELPRLIAQPDLRRFYPPEARRKDREGSVVLRLWLDATGAVTRAEIISNPGDGLGEAALRAARELRFSPAKIRGERVATSVPFTLHFVLH